MEGLLGPRSEILASAVATFSLTVSITSWLGQTLLSSRTRVKQDTVCRILMPLRRVSIGMQTT